MGVSMSADSGVKSDKNTRQYRRLLGDIRKQITKSYITFDALKSGPKMIEMRLFERNSIKDREDNEDRARI